MNLTIWLPNRLKKIAFILTRRGESRSELQKHIWMAVCRNLANLKNIGSDRKSVLRARRTRRPKMATFQNFQNSNRYDQNVGKVLISRNMALEIYKRHFRAKISLIAFFLIFWTQGGSAYGPLFGRPAFFFVDTGMSRSSFLTWTCKGRINPQPTAHRQEAEHPPRIEAMNPMIGFSRFSG